MRKRVIVPVVGVLVLATGFGAFKGYGAWTRSQPVDYSRGGDDFASLTDPSPTATPTAAPTGKATAAPAATGSPTALPRVDLPTAAPDVPRETAAPAPSRAAAGSPTAPRVGTYELAVTGSENVQFGPVGFCDQKLPARTSLVVKPATGEAPGAVDFDVPFFPDRAGQHDERHIYRFSPTAVVLEYEIATVTCQGVRQSSETSYGPVQPRVKLPLQVGASWHYTGGNDRRTEDAAFRVERTETLRIGGERVLTYVIRTTTTFTGDESGTRDQTWWYAPSWAMPVKWHDKQSGHRSGASYTGDVTATVLNYKGVR